MRRLLGGALASLLFLAAAQPATADDDWARLHWIDKVARRLRVGPGLEVSDPVSSLLAASDDEVIDYFFRDPRSADSIVDFHRSLLGQRSNALRNSDGSYSSSAFLLQGPWNAAQSVLSHGDYLESFSFRQPFFLPKLAKPSPDSPEEAAMPPAELRASRARKLKTDFDEIRAYASQQPAPTQLAVCRRARLKLLALGSMGVPDLLLRELLDSEFALGRLYGACALNRAENVVLVDELARASAIVASLADAFASLPSDYDPRDAASVKRLDDSGLVHQFSGPVRDILLNSSTNGDRKRGAYILRRYFCDDLVPVSVETPSTPQQVRHGTQASCAACHYKLEPMAGFFRNYGSQFFNFQGQTEIVFDDGAKKPLATYTQSWLADSSTGRRWDVGYVRSPQYTSRNEYGETLDDLFNIIKKAPEFKSCLTRRMFEYYVDEGQMVDPEFIESLAQKFSASRIAGRPSSDAYLEILRALLKSRSFKELEPDPRKCYDLAPGVDPTTRPPCQIAALFRRNCRSCHGSQNPEGGLDLTRWVSQPDGQMNFVHLDSQGRPVPRLETFRRLIDRLSTSDTARRMPLSTFMTSQDRQALYLWTSGEAGRPK